MDPSAREMVDTYLANMDAMLARGLGLLLHGGIQGTGKSLMAILTLKGILAKGHDCYFTTFSGLIERLMSGWDSKEQKAWFHSRIRNATVLVVDDVGREMKQRRMTSDGMKDYNTATSEFAIESVLRHRVANALPTIVTTNLSVDQLRDSYGQHFRSLMGEAMLQVAFRGTDWRSSSAQRLWQEAQSGLMRPVVLG